MSESETPSKPRGPDVVAFRYVAGTLPASERVRFERQLCDNAELRQQVAFWQEHLQTWYAHIEQLPSRENNEDEISSGIAPATHNAEPENAEPEKVKPFSWAALLQWGAPTVAAIALAAVLIGYYPKTIETTMITPDYVAVLTDERGNVLLAALISEEGNNMYLKWDEQLTVPLDKNLQLWAVSRRDGQTRPFAVFANTEIRQLPLNEASEHLVTDSAFLLLTEEDEEDEGGLSLDEPSDIILAKGAYVRFSSKSMN